MRTPLAERLGSGRMMAIRIVIILSLFGASALRAQPPAASEHQVKAVFLLRMAQFIDWPVDAFADKNAPVVIGILGSDPVGSFLDETVRSETLDGRRFEVRRYRAVDEIETCHILFIGRAEASRMGEVIAALRNRPILTVSDDEGFSTRGGMVRLATVDGRIRLRINVNAARDAKLTISSKLLRLAEIVTAERGQ